MKRILFAAVAVLALTSLASAQHPLRLRPLTTGAYTPYNAYGYYYTPVFGGYAPTYGGYYPSAGLGYGGIPRPNLVPYYGFGTGAYNAYGGFNAYGPYGGVNATGWGWGGAY